jgi:hypothetical protein
MAVAVARRVVCNDIIWKDPYAIMAAGWLAETFGLQVLVLTRHPAAFVDSYLRVDWGFRYAELLRQPTLMERYLEGFRRPLEQASVAALDRVDHAILLWRLFHHVIADHQDHLPDAIVVRHEDLAHDPQRQFSALYPALGLRMTDRIAERIRS